MEELKGTKNMEEKEENINELLESNKEIEQEAKEEKQESEEENKEEKEGFFKKYKIKDIVFLSIITACTLLTGAVMPLLVNIPLFGIIQLGLALQFSIFPVIGMLKVRKPGCLLYQSIFISIFLVFMFPAMVFIIACALVAELVALLIFRGYQNDWACVLATTLYLPLTLPLLALYYNVFYTQTGNEKAAVSMFLGGTNIYVIIGMSAAVIALCFLGSFIGKIISKELSKAGAFKK